MYDFKAINEVPVMEFSFKVPLAHYCMMFSDGNPDPKKRYIVLVPGFRIDTKGKLVSRNGTSVDPIEFRPSKDNVEKQLLNLLKACPASSSDMIILCQNEETEETGMAVVPKKKWYPVFSMI